MKSENHLIITGTVITDVNPIPGQSFVRFRIAHYFEGGKKPLFLDCVRIIKPGTESQTPRKGDAVRVCAYLQMRADYIVAVVKSMDIEP